MTEIGLDNGGHHNSFDKANAFWVGFVLEPYQHSFRKRLAKTPKFYFFDVGVARTLARTHRLPLAPQTYSYSDYFEQFFITECYKLCQYFRPDFRLGFVRTKDDLEIDLVIERPGKPLIFIEIKSSTKIDESMVSALRKIRPDFPEAKMWCISNDPITKIFSRGMIQAIPWQAALLSLAYEGGGE